MRARGIALSMEIVLFLRDVRSSEHRMRVDVANAIEFNIQPSIKLPTHPRSYSGCAKSSIIPEDIKDIDKHARNRRRGNVMLYLRTHRIKDVLIWTPTLTLVHLAEPMLEKCSQQLPDLSPDTKMSPRSRSLGSCCFGGSTRCNLKMVPIMYFSSVIAKLLPGQARAPWPNGVQFRCISSVASSQRRGCHDSGSGYTDASRPWS